MNEQWQSFISQYPTNTLESTIDSGAALFNLSSDYALLEFTGEDAKNYLQGQLTNDINNISNSSAQLSGYCNPKGRLLALFQIFSIDDKIYLQLPANLLAKTLKRMKMFVMMSKVEIKDVSNEWISIGLAGKNLDKLLAEHFNEMPTKLHDVVSTNGLTLINISEPSIANVAQFQCLASIETMQSLCSQLFDKNIKKADFNAWKTLTIKAGIPIVEEDTVEAFVPQTLNMHLINAINFKKGCYTGQEVVARMHYLGKVKRLMYLLQFNTLTSDIQQQVKSGDSLYSPQSSSGQGAGKIVSVSSLSATDSKIMDGEIIMLAVLEVSTAAQDSIYLDEAHTVKGTILELPYSLEAEEK
ncbi:MAG: folate-binding protein [Pseudomonadota bacterium]